MIHWAFGKFPIVITLWLCMSLSTVLVVYPLFNFWCNNRTPGPASKYTRTHTHTHTPHCSCDMWEHLPLISGTQTVMAIGSGCSNGYGQRFSRVPTRHCNEQREDTNTHARHTRTHTREKNSRTVDVLILLGKYSPWNFLEDGSWPRTPRIREKSVGSFVDRVDGLYLDGVLHGLPDHFPLLATQGRSLRLKRCY